MMWPHPVAAGDIFHAMGCEIEVRRVAKDRSWADVLVRQDSIGARWTKRQPMPFPANWMRAHDVA